MIPFVFLILLSGMFCFVAVTDGQAGRKRLYIGRTEKVQAKNLAFPVFFLFLFALMALKDETIGTDTQNYKYYFELYSDSSWKTMVTADLDVLYVFFIRLVGLFTDNFQIFLVIISAVIIYPIAKLYMEDREYSYLKIVLFVSMATFIMLFSGLRQSLAMAVGVIAYNFVRKKQPIRFILAVLVALGIHHSGFILLPMYWLYHATFKRKHLFFIVPAIALVFIFNGQIFTILTNFLAQFSDEYQAEITDTGATTMLLLFAMFAALCYIVPDEKSMDRETLGLRNFLLLSVAMQCFAPLHTIAMRLNYYYILFIPIIVPKCIALASPRFKQVAKLTNIVLCMFFTFYFFMICYNALTDPQSFLHAIPYIPFWSE